MTTETTNDERLNAVELAALRTKLFDERRFRLDQLHGLQRSPETKDVQGPGRSSAAQAEVRSQLLAAATAVLAEIDAALDRMESGRYGRCDLCRRPIGVQRLRILPQARYCAPCHHDLETNR